MGSYVWLCLEEAFTWNVVLVIRQAQDNLAWHLVNHKSPCQRGQEFVTPCKKTMNVDVSNKIKMEMSPHCHSLQSILVLKQQQHFLEYSSTAGNFNSAEWESVGAPHVLVLQQDYFVCASSNGTLKKYRLSLNLCNINKQKWITVW